jgi:hypothetical protein
MLTKKSGSCASAAGMAGGKSSKAKAQVANPSSKNFRFETKLLIELIMELIS